MSKKKVLSKFMVLCWAAFIAVLDQMWAAGWTPLHLHSYSNIVDYIPYAMLSWSILTLIIQNSLALLTTARSGPQLPVRCPDCSWLPLSALHV